MMTQDDLLQERLARLEAGEPLEACLDGMIPEEATLLRRAAQLRSVPEHGLDPSRFAASRREFLWLAEEQWKQRPSLLVLPRQVPATRRPRWALPLALAGGALAVVVAAVVLRSRSEIAALGGLAPVHISAPDPQTAVLNDRIGLVEIQAANGSWAPAANGTTIRAGQRLRTGALTSAAVDFYDGSQARLGPTSELSVEQLDAQRQGPRVVVLHQWAGESEHSVAASTDPGSQYTVSSPSASGTAKGTAFRVRITAGQAARYEVSEGTVAVSAMDVTVLVVAGQCTWVPAGQAPEAPVFWSAGEGVVESIAEAGWMVAGQPLVVNGDTMVLGEPRPGDWVSFQVRLLLDGTRVADRISVLERGPTSSFRFDGTLDAMASDRWTIAGRSIGVDEQSVIDPLLAIGNLVEVRGHIHDDGSLRASHIRVLSHAAGDPFEFVGTVESITDTLRTISGIPVAINADTQIEPGTAVGHIVRVRGVIQPDGTWLATSIKPALEAQRDLVIVGLVRSRDPWIVAGRRFEVRDRTQIDEGISIGDRVRVIGRGLPDGRWIASEIQSLRREQERRFTIDGRVTGTAPWSVAGIPFAVDGETMFQGDVVAGVLVRVSGVVLADGVWVARRVKRLEGGRGCLDFSSAVRLVEGGKIVLFDGRELELGDDIEVRGSIQPASVVRVSGCVQEDGVLVVALILVLSRLEAIPVAPVVQPVVQPEPVVPVQRPVVPMPSGGSIDIRENNKTLTLSCEGIAVTVRGNKNDVTLLGSCANVTVLGNKNTITLDGAGSIVNRGNKNVIRRR